MTKNKDEEGPKEISSGSEIKRDRDRKDKDEEGNVNIAIVEPLVEEWVTEIQEICDKEIAEEKEMDTAWDYVHGGICL